MTSVRSISLALDHLGARLHFVVLSRLPDHPSLGQSDPLSTARIRKGDRVGLGLSLVEAERRIAVSHQRRIGHDSKNPTIHPDHEGKDAARVAAGKEKRDHAEDNEQKNQPAAGAAEKKPSIQRAYVDSGIPGQPAASA